MFDALIDRYALVQLPVMPLRHRHRGWGIAGSYGDEFAESHGKTLPVREALGAAIPAAGVGCAFARTALDALAVASPAGPFDADSLTEDYELGLRLAGRDERGIFVRIADERGALVAVRAHFPDTLDCAVRQKGRWIAGIALSGWDRLGWRGGIAERWMRLDDRRAVVAAVVIASGYGALVLGLAALGLSALAGASVAMSSPALALLLRVSSGLLLWRLAMRALLVGRYYGWRQAAWSVPRTVVANLIAIAATRRAIAIYLAARRDGVTRWDKTAHHFPDVAAAA